MLNTIFRCLAAKRNSHIVPVIVPVVRKDKSIFNKYFRYFIEDGYSESEAKLISDVFQNSADHADVYGDIDLHALASTSRLSLCCTGVVGLYACPKGTSNNQLVCKLSLETALSLAKTWDIRWEHTSRHFLEYYFLA